MNNVEEMISAALAEINEKNTLEVEAKVKRLVANILYCKNQIVILAGQIESNKKELKELNLPNNVELGD